MHNCALHALNKHLGVFRGHRGNFTTDEAAKLLEAAGRYMADPVNQISLTRPILLSGSRERD
jgi:hypothetical protein